MLFRSGVVERIRVPSPAASTTAASGRWTAISLSLLSLPSLLTASSRSGSLGGRVSNPDLGLQRTPCCRYTTPDGLRGRPYPERSGAPAGPLGHLRPATARFPSLMGSLIKKRRKRMRKKKHKKLLKKTRWQRRNQGR
mgnify:FL=1